MGIIFGRIHFCQKYFSRSGLCESASVIAAKLPLRGEEEEPQAICSFRGSFANRENGMSEASADEVRGAERIPFNAEPSEAGPR